MAFNLAKAEEIFDEEEIFEFVETLNKNPNDIDVALRKAVELCEFGERRRDENHRSVETKPGNGRSRYQRLGFNETT